MVRDYTLGINTLISVSDNGEVTLASGRIKKWQVDPRWGYVSAAFWVDGKHLKISQHRLVATVFLPNPDGLPEVNHKDGNKANNHVSNLEWVTSAQNKEHAIRMGLRERLPAPLHELNVKRRRAIVYKGVRYESVNDCIRAGHGNYHYRLRTHPEDTYYVDGRGIGSTTRSKAR